MECRGWMARMSQILNLVIIQQTTAVMRKQAEQLRQVNAGWIKIIN